MSLNISEYQNEILENILHGVIITDLRGHIVFWNNTSQKFFGYSKEDILSKPVRMLYGDDEKMPFKRILEECVSGKEVHGQWHGIQKNGLRIWLDVRAKVLRKGEGESDICLITVCNIGKLKYTQYRLKKNEKLAQTIFETSVDAILIIDDRGYILNFNRSTTEMFGYGNDELKGEKVNVLMPFPYNDNHDAFMENYKVTGEKKVIGMGREVQGLKKDGTVFPIEFTVNEITSGERRLFAGIIRDLTTRRNLERQILEIGNEERRNIGRELHDDLGQMLTGIRMLSENLASKLKANGLPGAEEVEEIASMVNEADERARILTRGLVQVDLENKGLSVAIQNLCKQVAKATGINCEYSESGDVELESHSMSLHIFRIAQEAISNAVKHADAENVFVRLSSNNHHTSLIINDDGIGFETEDENNFGSGIQIMKHRAGIMGGVVEIVRTEDTYTQVRCIVPNNEREFN